MFDPTVNYRRGGIGRNHLPIKRPRRLLTPSPTPAPLPPPPMPPPKRVRSGPGDVVEAVAKAIGADKLANAVAKLMGKKSCGCRARKEKMNKAWEKFRARTGRG